MKQEMQMVPSGSGIQSDPELETDVYPGNPTVCHKTYLGHLLWRTDRLRY